MKANCPICGKEFIKRGRAKSCSRECGKKISIWDRFCIECGTCFKAIHALQKCCSKRCKSRRDAARKKYIPSKGVIAACKICGQPFVKRGPAILCSDTCRKAHINEYAKSARRKGRPPRTCGKCAGPIPKDSSRRKYCSQSCVAMSRAEQNAARIRKPYVNSEQHKQYMRERKQIIRASKHLGIPAMLYTAMKFVDRFNHTEGQSA